MARKRRPTNLSVAQANVLTYNQRLAHELADAPETWTRGDVPPVVCRNIRTLKQKDLIETADRYDDGADSDDADRYARYRLRQGVRGWIEQHITWSPPPGPCNHGGVRNCGDHYECREATCDAEFGREIAKQRLGGGDE